MKHLLIKLFLISLFFGATNCKVNQAQNKLENTYTRLEQRIYNDIEEYRVFKKEEIQSSIFVYDLSDNRLIKPAYPNDTSMFHANHLYHFGVAYIPQSYSYIAYLDKNGELKIFEAINCKDRGNSLDDVLQFIENNKQIKSDDLFLERVKNYRKYGFYTTVDTPDIDCDCEPCDSDSIFDN